MSSYYLRKLSPGYILWLCLIAPLIISPISTCSAQTNDPDSLALTISQGWMRYMREVQTANCLVRNEASESELMSGNLASGFFVPNQMAYSILAEILSYEVKKQYPALTQGYDSTELVNALSCQAAAIEDILDQYAYLDSPTLAKAFFQVHLIDGSSPQGNPFERTISMLDNLYLITALHVAQNWTLSIDPALSQRFSDILSQFSLNMWEVSGGRWYIGGDLNPRDGSVTDRILSESRLVFPAALARGEMNIWRFVQGITYTRNQSMSYTSPDNTVVREVPFFGRELEVFVPTAFLSMEPFTQFGTETLHPLLEARESAKCDL
ncbi:MAG: hypothetical protein AAFV07_00460, partial [Bacteroidota bacterium]